MRNFNFSIINVYLLLLISIKAQGNYGNVSIYKNNDRKLTKIIFDTDGATDDMRALTLALQTPTVQVIAITATHGGMNASQTVANVNRILALNGLRGIIPVYKGCGTPLILNHLKQEPYFNGIDGLGDRSDVSPKAIPSYSTSYDPNESAAEAIIKLTKLNPNVTLVATGALTNVALALKLNPDFSRNLKKLVIMGGNYLGIGNAYAGKSTEWNFAMDPEAAAIVLREFEGPITVIPWEAYYIQGQSSSQQVNYTKHLYLGTPLSDFFLQVTEKGRNALAETGSQMAYVDEIAMGVAIDEDLIVLDSKNLGVKVELAGQYSRGQVVPDWVNRNYVEPMIDHQMITNSSIQGLIKFVTNYNVTLLDEWINQAFSHQTKSN